MVLILNIISILYIYILYIRTIPANINEYLLGIQFLIIFVLNTYSFLKKYRKENIICFDTFFAFAFFFSTFQYPFLIKFWPPYIINKYFAISNMVYVSGMCVAMLGYLSYLLGAIIINRSKANNSFTRKYNNNIYRLNPIFQYLTLLLFLIIFIGGGHSILSQYYNPSEDRWGNMGNVIFYLYIVFNISSILQFIKIKSKGINNITDLIKRIDKIYLVNAILVLSFFFISGHRSEFVFLFLPILFLYSLFIKRIKNRDFFLIIFAGLILLSLVGFIRSLEGGLLNLNNLISSLSRLDLSYLFRDLTSANGSIYFFIDYVDNYGITYGKNMLLQFVSFIPFFQSILINVFGLNPVPYSSYIYTTELHGINFSSGQGTHIISDLYYSFGLTGVVILMFALGVSVSYLYGKLYTKNSSNIYILILYCILFGNSIYATRVEYFFIMRTIGFSLIIYWLFNSFIKVIKK